MCFKTFDWYCNFSIWFNYWVQFTGFTILPERHVLYAWIAFSSVHMNTCKGPKTACCFTARLNIHIMNGWKKQQQHINMMLVWCMVCNVCLCVYIYILGDKSCRGELQAAGPYGLPHSSLPPHDGLLAEGQEQPAKVWWDSEPLGQAHTQPKQPEKPRQSLQQVPKQHLAYTAFIHISSFRHFVLYSLLFRKYVPSSPFASHLSFSVSLSVSFLFCLSYQHTVGPALFKVNANYGVLSSVSASIETVSCLQNTDNAALTAFVTWLTPKIKI